MKDLETEYDDCPLCQWLAETEGMRLAVPYDELVNAGVGLPPAELLTDDQIREKIAQMIETLAALNVCIASTDHLSDRELYRRLCDDLLREPTDIFFGSERGVTTINLIGGGSEEDIEIYLTYYADDETREQWALDFPEDPIPPKKPLPYDRDRFHPTLETLHARDISSMDH